MFVDIHPTQVVVQLFAFLAESRFDETEKGSLFGIRQERFFACRCRVMTAESTAGRGQKAPALIVMTRCTLPWNWALTARRFIFAGDGR
jgi:hypothetical protein